MNIKRAKTEIKHAITAYLEKDEYGEYRIPEIRQRPILLMGPPGIGKTQIMEQIAGEMDLALASYTITHHTRQSAIGLPFIRDKVYGGQTHSVTEYTMSEIIASMYDRMEGSGKTEGILFIDEINCVSETLAPTMLRFLQGKSFGNQKIPEGWVIVAAGNPPEYNRSVRDFDVVTLDRVRTLQIEPEYAVWKEYALAVGIHGAVVSYLDIHKENFYRMETTVDGKQFVTARGWEDLSELLYAYERQGMTVDREIIMEYLQHPGTAKDFAAYLELYYKYRSDYRVDEILQGSIRPGTLNKLKFAPFDEHLEVIGLLLTRLSENFAAAVRHDAYVGKLFGLLKRASVRLEDEETNAAAMFREMLELEQGAVEQRAAAGQNEKELLKESRPLIAALEQIAVEMETYHGRNSEAAERLREIFTGENQKLTDLEEETSHQLEYAFDFMEAAFGESQEMVVFITELSAGTAAVKFLNEHPCDRYYMYNKTLLFEDREAKLRGRLNAIRGVQEGGSYHL